MIPAEEFIQKIQHLARLTGPELSAALNASGEYTRPTPTKSEMHCVGFTDDAFGGWPAAIYAGKMYDDVEGQWLEDVRLYVHLSKQGDFLASF